MRPEIHPEYQEVLFHDTNADAYFIIGSTLKPQQTKSYEVGAKASLFGEKLQLGAAVFQTEISNARVLDDTNTASFIGETRIRGFEFNVSGTILPG